MSHGRCLSCTPTHLCQYRVDPLSAAQLSSQVNRGTAVMVVSPSDGTDEIANPFLQQEVV
jgi:hypothetical protein